MASKRKLSLANGAGSFDSVESSSSPAEANDLVSAAEALTSLQSVSPIPASEETHPLVSKVNQLTGHPIVTNAVKYYESTKRNYAPFNYAADIVEKAALPVVNRIGVNLNNRHQQRLAEEDISVKKRRVVENSTSGSNQQDIQSETKKRLQFCLHILRLANDNINCQVNSLHAIVDEHQQEQKMKEEKTKESEEAAAENKFVKEATPEQVTETAKTEIAVTVKKIIHLISNFKPSSLSLDNSDIKSSIRDIILNLPSQINGSDNDKVFIFAKESLDMISKLTNVFSDQLNLAETWIGSEENHDNDLTAVNSSVGDEITSHGSTETLSDESIDSKAKSIPKEPIKEKHDRITIDMLTK
jgi:bZIP factor